MVKDEKIFTGIQGNIFSELENRPEDAEYDDSHDLDLQAELRAACAHALKLARRQGITRERVVDEMNRLMPELDKGKQITLRKLNAWMATSKEDSEFPARFLPAFCAATRCYQPLQEMAKALGMDLADQRELIAKQYGELEIEKARIAREVKTLKAKLTG